MKKSIGIIAVVLLLVMFSSTISAQSISFEFTTVSATCNATQAPLTANANVELPSVLVDVIENGIITRSTVVTNSGATLWDNFDAPLDSSRKFTKVIRVYNGMTSGSGIATQAGYVIDCSGRTSGENATVTINNGSSSISGGTTARRGQGPQPAFYDGRINNYDSAAPVAVYPITINGETGLHVYSSAGELLLIVSPQEIADAPENPSENIIITENQNVYFARIVGAEGGIWQISAPQYNGKTYVLIFGALYPNTGYTSYEE